MIYLDLLLLGLEFWVSLANLGNIFARIVGQLPDPRAIRKGLADTSSFDVSCT